MPNDRKPLPEDDFVGNAAPFVLKITLEYPPRETESLLGFMPKEGTNIEGFVHETISSTYSEAKLHGKMYHYTYDNWHQYFNKFNNYTTLAAKKYKENGKSCSFVKDILIRPSWAFFKVYILDRGFLDGKMGFILSVNHYFYTMIKYVKLYYLLKSNGKL